MAEAATASLATQTKSVLCRYFLSGVCREGASCKFSHDRSNATPDNICRFYLRGTCAYGNTCRYDHIRSDRLPNQSQSSGNAGGSQATKSSEKSGRSPPLAVVSSKKGRNIDSPTGQMTVLRPRHSASSNGETSHQENKNNNNNNKNSGDWLNAPEFVPRVQKSYADTMKGDSAESVESEATSSNMQLSVQLQQPQLHPGIQGVVGSSLGKSLLCPYAVMGECSYGEQCLYLHGDVCEFCGHACLHPFDQEQRQQHREDCIREHERDMELSFAVQRSQNKVCGICMDIVMEKEPLSERRFGILEKCNHIFCLNCIRKWRNTKTFDNKTIRGCPECRTSSDFVTPSKFWVETSEEKDKLISDYKKALSSKPCKYFKQGRGECPFAGACFYLHAYPDGSKAEMPLPQRRRRKNQDGEWEAVERIIMWDFFEVRDNHLLFHLDLDEMFDILSDIDDDTDLSDVDLILE